jgi:heat shock protein HtpX
VAPVSGLVRRPVGWGTRLAPAVLAFVGIVLVGWVLAAVVDPVPQETPAEVRLLLLVPAVVLVLVGAALAIDPRPLPIRRALAGAALLWLLFLAAVAVIRAGQGRLDAYLVGAALLAAIIGGSLLALAVTTDEVSDERLPGPLGRLAATVLFSIAILVAAVSLVLVATFITWALRTVQEGTLPRNLPWWAVTLVVVLPVVTFAIAALDARRGGRRDFRAQQAANRRNSLLLLVTLVGVVAAVAEIITASLTFSATPALIAAAFAAAVGLGAAFGADRFGAEIVLETAGAKHADAREHRVLLDVVDEASLAANVPVPRLYVIDDGSMNAFATGRDPAHASLAVTRGLLTRLDREELQGVIGHEVGHIRNYDTRYALYVAVLVGIVALVTDGFLRLVVEGWRQGAFIWTGGDDAKETVAAFVSGILVGLFLLIVAFVLRIVAPLFSLLVQAAVSREREYLADATSVELTRNPIGLERALASLADDTDELDGANRGTQHLWFRNPVKAGSDRGPGIFATHPSLGARIARLQRMRGVAGAEAEPPPALANDS